MSDIMNESEKNDFDSQPVEVSFFKRCILGFFLGLAVIVPGVSGSTIAVIFKLYDKIVWSISNILKRFKPAILFLIPLAFGAIVGVLTGFLTVQKLLQIIPFALVAAFAGLMLGSMKSLANEGNAKATKKSIILIIAGMIVPIGMSLASIFIDDDTKNVDVNAINLIIFMGLGFIVAITQLVPGCSATATLLALGYFKKIMDTAHVSYIKDNPSVLLLYGALILGFLIGAVSTAKLIEKLINRYKETLYMVFIGLSIGSICAMLFNIDMLDVYKSWSVNGVDYLDLFLGIGLFIVGFIVSFRFIVYSIKNNQIK